jgi:hypothetical protein
MNDAVNLLQPSNIDCTDTCRKGRNGSTNELRSEGDPRLLSRWSDSRGQSGPGVGLIAGSAAGTEH